MCQFLVLAITAGEKKVPVVCLAGCAVVSVLVLAITTDKKKSSSHLSGGLCCCILCQFLVLAGNRQIFVVAGKFYYDRKNKKF